jgi:hypothetical protein
MVVPPSNSTDRAATFHRLLEQNGRYTNHDVLVEPEHNLGDGEGSRAFVQFAKEYSFALANTKSIAKVVSRVALVMEVWNKYNTGRFLERRSEKGEEESERVVASKTDALMVAVKCFFGLRKAATKQGPGWMRKLVNPADQSVVDAFWKDNNDAVAAAK